MQLPTISDVNEKRVERFKDRITQALGSGEADQYQPLIEQYEREHNVPALEIAAALASLAQGKKPLLLAGERERDREEQRERPREAPRERPREEHRERPRKPERAARSDAHERPTRTREERSSPPPPEEMETYRIEVGHVHGVKPANIMGAIANEAGLEGQHIGRIDIHEDHSFVDLPQGMPKEIFRHLQKVRVAGQQLQIGRARKDSQSQRVERPARDDRRKPAGRGDRPKHGKPQRKHKR